MVSPWKTGLGNSTFSKPRLPTVVPRVVSLTESPTATPRVKRLFTRGLPNSAWAAAWKSTWSGCGFMVRQEKKTLSASVTVRPGWCWNTCPTVSSSKSLPAMEGLRSAGGALQHLGIELAEQELAVRGGAHELAALGDHAPAQDGDRGPARNLPAFPRTVVRHVEVLLGQRLADRRIHDGEVRVAARSDDALARIEAEDLRGVGGGDVGEALEAHATLAHTLREGDAEPRLRSHVAARDVLDGAPAELQFEARRILVGGQRGESAVHQPVPQRLLVLRELEGRIGVGAEAARGLVVLRVEAGVLVERLAVHGYAESTRLADGVHALAGRGVDEVHGGVHGSGQGDGATEGEQLGELGVDEVHVRPVHASFLAEALVVELDEILVLAVDDHDAAVLGRLLHGEADAPEVETVARPLRMRRQHVGGEDLEGWMPRLDRLGHLLEHAQGESAGQGDVEGIVHVRLPLPALGPLLEYGHDVVARPHVAEVDVGGRAPASHAPRVLLGAEGQGRLLRVRHDAVGEMRVGLHAARGHDEAGGVDDLCRLAGQGPRSAQHRDAPVLDTHVPGPHALRRDDASATDHEIEHAPSLAQPAEAVK